MCLCVGESKKDKMGAALQGGAIIEVGGQYSNAAPFTLVSAPTTSTVFARRSVASGSLPAK